MTEWIRKLNTAVKTNDIEAIKELLRDDEAVQRELLRDEEWTYSIELGYEYISSCSKSTLIYRNKITGEARYIEPLGLDMLNQQLCFSMWALKSIRSLEFAKVAIISLRYITRFNKINLIWLSF